MLFVSFSMSPELLVSFTRSLAAAAQRFHDINMLGVPPTWDMQHAAISISD